MPPPLLLLQDISLTFGATPLLSRAALSVASGDRICLVGRNGSGKSTLLRIAAGLVHPDAGECFTQPGASVQYLPQEPDLSGFDTTLAFVEAGFGEAVAESRHRALYLLIVLISHDRRLLERFSHATVWLDRGITRTLDEGFSAFEAWRDDILEREESEQHKLGRKIAMEEDWLRYGVTARRTRNQRRLAELHALRRQRREHLAATGTARLEATQAVQSGRLVMVAQGLSKFYGDRPIVRNFSTRIVRGDRVGIVGPNGAGKTTLLNLLTGVLAPDAGELRLGTNLARLTLDQHRETLDPEQSLADALTGGGETVTVGGQSRHVVGYMKDFLFRPEQARTPVGALSGGERARLTLARAFARPSNLLVLDEPTNDLDLETLDLLQEKLADYAGTVLLVSHDRDFLDRVATSVIASEGGGRWIEYAGGYTDMLAQRAASHRPAPPAPARNLRQSRPATSSSRSPSGRLRRMTFNDRRALELLPARIAALETQIAELHAALADAELYARDPARFGAITEALAAARKEQGAAEEQWLTLEMLREEIEGAEPR